MIDNSLLTRPWPAGRAPDSRASLAVPAPAPVPVADVVVLTPEAQAALVANLVRFLIVVVIISGLFCTYVWQLSTILAIEKHTDFLYREVDRFERENVALMIDVAAKTSPAVIEQRARTLGMVPSGPTTRVALAAGPEAGLDAPAGAGAISDPLQALVDRLVAWWQDIAGRLPRLPFSIG